MTDTTSGTPSPALSPDPLIPAPTGEAPPRELAHITAILLNQGEALDRWSLTCFGLGLAALILMPLGRPTCLALGTSLLLGLAQHYLAFRVRLDQAVFRQWSKHRGALAPLLIGFDAALTQLLGGAPQAPQPPRSLIERCLGARRWLGLQALAFVAQALLLIGSLALAAARIWN